LVSGRLLNNFKNVVMEYGGGQMSEQFRRKRKMMLIMPLIVAPMLCLGFHGLGGGKGEAKHAGVVSEKGLNMSLPEARFDPKKKLLNKLGFYTQAEQDSVKMMERRKQDPFYNRDASHPDALVKGGLPGDGMNGAIPGRRDSVAMPGRPLSSPLGSHGVALTPNMENPEGRADELLQKLDKLKEVLAKHGTADGLDKIGLPGGTGLPGSPGIATNGLRPVYAGVPAAAPGPGDPDLDKLNGMLDKILRVQHPAETGHADTAMPGREKTGAGVLTIPGRDDTVRTMTTDGSERQLSGTHRPGPGEDKDVVEQDPGSGFMELADEPQGGDATAAMIEAVVDKDQTLVSGESVELRLSQEALINGVAIPRGTLVTGKASLSGERLLVTVSSLLVGRVSVPVSLEVVDLDGLAGIRERGSINRDVSKESAGEAVGSLGVTSLDPSLGGQAAAAGLEAAKTLLNRKVRLVRVSITAGYRVFLRNTKTNR
jgi:hypothetical protein